jgi:hypothetical protein
MLAFVDQIPQVLLPDHLPAACFVSAASDYDVPELVLVALVKKESNGRAVTHLNANGSYDVGVSQINTGSWLPYLQRSFGITSGQLLANNCLAIRAAAYVIRMETSSRACLGRDFWCGVGRYHSPGDPRRAMDYVADVWRIATRLAETGKF